MLQNYPLWVIPGGFIILVLRTMRSQRVFVKMATRNGVGRRRKSSKQTPLEASLEHLQSVAGSLEKKNPPKPTNFFLSYDGSGNRVPQSKRYKYRSVAERASKNKRGESTQSNDWDSLGKFVINICWILYKTCPIQHDLYLYMCVVGFHIQVSQVTWPKVILI